MKRIKLIIVLMLSIFMTMILCACPIAKSGGDKTEKIDTNFNATTNISYSSGTDSNWSYGNQRKEFPRDEACYVRISSTIVAEKKKGVDTEITVTYTFTGTDNCKVELSDGIAKKSNSDNSNELVFTRTVSAETDKKASESIVIFQYMPNSSADSITLQVTYDDHVPEYYDERNTIYFKD